MNDRVRMLRIWQAQNQMQRQKYRAPLGEEGGDGDTVEGGRGHAGFGAEGLAWRPAEVADNHTISLGLARPCVPIRICLKNLLLEAIRSLFSVPVGMSTRNHSENRRKKKNSKNSRPGNEGREKSRGTASGRKLCRGAAKT